MQYIIYRTDNEANYILFDLENKKVVWRSPDISPTLSGDSGSIPIWRPDSSALTYLFRPINDEYGNYYTIFISGRLEKLTSYTQENIIGLGSGWKANPSWSPDGRYLIFRTYPSGEEQSFRLTIWDNKEKNTLVPCLPDEAEVDPGSSIIYWAVDGSSFLMSLFYPDPVQEGKPITGHFKTIFVDLINKTVVELPVGENDKLFSDTKNDKFLGWVGWEIP